MYGRYLDELIDCGQPAGSSRTEEIKEMIIMQRVPVRISQSKRRAVEGQCWASGSVQPLCGTVGTKKVSRACAEKLLRLTTLADNFETFLHEPFHPTTARTFLRVITHTLGLA